MVNLTAYGVIRDGKLTLANRKRFEQDLKEFKDSVVELSIRKKNRRTTQSNRFYWGVVVKEIQIRLRELGNDFDSETIHEFLKEKFNRVEIIGEGGELLGYAGGSTADMNKDAFGEYLDKIIAWCSEFLTISIPQPGEVLEFNF